jgi:hypothetical protein
VELGGRDILNAVTSSVVDPQLLFPDQPDQGSIGKPGILSRRGKNWSQIREQRLRHCFRSGNREFTVLFVFYRNVSAALSFLKLSSQLHTPFIPWEKFLSPKYFYILKAFLLPSSLKDAQAAPSPPKKTQILKT